VHTPGAKTHEWICTIDGSKRVKSGKDVPKILHCESSFSRKTRINLGGNAAKIRI